METPVQIDFQGMTPGLTLQEFIEDHMTGLEKYFGHMTAARIVVKGPDKHHNKGGLYEVNIHLILPGGREVNVSRTPQADERHADVRYAISDAFRRARRRLQDKARRLQRKVKRHEEAPVATVAKIAAEGDYGFLETEDGREIYFHKNSVLNADMSALKLGTRVTFFEEVGEKGAQASTVRLLGKHGMK